MPLHPFLHDEVPPTFADFLAALYTQRHTGPITIEFLCGVPQAIVIPPTHVDRIRLAQVSTPAVSNETARRVPVR